MTERILVVEDDENLRLPLVDNLEDEGFEVEQASSGEAAVELARRQSFDVIVLDIMLPGMSGYDVCKVLRAEASTAGILMLTARSLEDDVVTGFDAGADDYLTKPYRLRELLARVRALLRRRAPSSAESPRPAETVIDLDGIRIDASARTVVDASGAHVELTRTEFDLLVFMVTHQGEALAREVILDKVWGNVRVDPRTVDNFVSNLKKKLGWTKDRKFAFRAVRGVGYRLVIGEG
ncbi:MAG: response regulator transcription factor [Nannocystaceae bacterium]|nr:response regulator transcription factor [bacterium]